jgi:hypothetical protein
MSEEKFKGDADLLASMTDDEREKFIVWMTQLDLAHVRAGRPYGTRSLWESTGAECWVHAFRDGDDPADALAEDLSYVDC